jgi:hypothetical protein
MQRGWKQGSKTWKRNWTACMNDEYDRLIGYRAANLATPRCMERQAFADGCWGAAEERLGDQPEERLEEEARRP